MAWPWLFAGYERLGSGCLISIAESTSALSQKEPKDSEAALPLVAYAIEPPLIGSLHRLGAASYLLGNVQNVLRCAGKGSTIKARITGFPVPLPDPKLDAMTALVRVLFDLGRPCGQVASGSPHDANIVRRDRRCLPNGSPASLGPASRAILVALV